MEAKDSRIGNYVLADIGMLCLYTHKLLPNDLIDLINGKLKDKIKPKPLTEEWLKEKYICNIYNEGIWNKIECRLDKDSPLPYFTVYYSKTRKEFCYVVAHERINKGFNSVHKLQNIHYEIKGEELKIK